MKHAILSLALRTVFAIAGRRSGVRRHLPDFEGQAIALRLAGIASPFIIVVRDGHIRLDPSMKPGAEIEGDLRTFIDIFFGRLDYDAAFFRGRISFHGSLPLAMRFKALFDHLTP